MTVLDNIDYIRSVSDSLTEANFDVWKNRLQARVEGLGLQSDGEDWAGLVRAVQAAWNACETNHSQDNIRLFKHAVGVLYQRRLENPQTAPQEEAPPWTAFSHLSRYPELYLQTFNQLNTALYDYLDPIWQMFQTGEYMVHEIGCDPQSESAILSFQRRGSDFRIEIRLVENSCTVGFREANGPIQPATVEELCRLSEEAQRRTSLAFRTREALQNAFALVRATTRLYFDLPVS